jgi:K(+)-stimulated pyrophosphate-energized sodium pump
VEDSPHHSGNTVGDPFKDTSGPSMNILIKLTCLVGLVIAPILGEIYGSGVHADASLEVDGKAIEVKVTEDTETENNVEVTVEVNN